MSKLIIHGHFKYSNETPKDEILKKNIAKTLKKVIFHSVKHKSDNQREGN